MYIGQLFISEDSLSQGFDWQNGARFPYVIPNLYVGVSTSYSGSVHNGNFNLKEDLIDCCSFTDGSGNEQSFGIVTEYWYDGLTALSANINFSAIKGDFSVRTVLPTREGEFVSDYGFNSTLKYLDLELLVRRRIGISHFSAGAGLNLGFLLTSEGVYTEQAVSDNVPFERRILSTGTIRDLRSFSLSPFVYLAYDANLGTGYYASPNLSLSYTLNSIIAEESWRRLSISFGIRIVRSI
jgi:hypothetical protein